MARRDFTGDGASDLLWIHYGNEKALWDFEDGTPRFVRLPPASSPPYYAAGSGDYNSDGRLDFGWEYFAVAGTGHVDGFGFWTGGGNGLPTGFAPAIASANTYGGGVGFPFAPVQTNVNFTVAVTDSSDFNGDGHADVMLLRDASPVLDLVSLHPMAQPGGAPVLISSLPFDPVFRVAGIDDFNGDGTTDVLWRQGVTGELGIWSMANGAPYAWHSFGVIPGNWVVARTGDFNGDGHADLLWAARDRDGGLLTGIWTITGEGGRYDAAWTALPKIYGAWAPVKTGDFTGDGSEDAFWRNGASGENLVWDFDNGAVSRAIAMPTVATDWAVG